MESEAVIDPRSTLTHIKNVVKSAEIKKSKLSDLKNP